MGDCFREIRRSVRLLVTRPGFTMVAVLSLALGVQPLDPFSLAVGAVTMFVVALAAGLVPARRAARLDPLVALRRE